MTENMEKKTCQACNKTFQNDKELQEHRQQMHSNEKGEKRPGSTQQQPEKREPKTGERVA